MPSSAVWTFFDADDYLPKLHSGQNRTRYLRPHPSWQEPESSGRAHSWDDLGAANPNRRRAGLYAPSFGKAQQ
jgi:hypothetical protein